MDSLSIVLVGYFPGPGGFAIARFWEAEGGTYGATLFIAEGESDGNGR